jgi:hypothetical protein
MFGRWIMRRILVVDDEPSIRQALILGLTSQEFEVDGAEDGNRGVGLGTRKHYDVLRVLQKGGTKFEKIYLNWHKLCRNVSRFVFDGPLLVAIGGIWVTAYLDGRNPPKLTLLAYSAEAVASVAKEGKNTAVSLKHFRVTTRP